MRTRFIAILTLSVFVGCGAHEKSAGNDPATPESRLSESAPAAVGENAASSEPCAALDAPFVRYDAAGKPMAYTFEYPGGWTVKELFVSGATSLDIVKSVDDDDWPELVLRFGHVVDKPLDNPAKLVETWRKIPMSSDIFEVDVEGRTMYVSRTSIGSMKGFQALFPDVKSEKAWMVSGGVPQAPKECQDKASETVERIIRSFRPNTDIGAPPPAQ